MTLTSDLLTSKLVSELQVTGDLHANYDLLQLFVIELCAGRDSKTNRLQQTIPYGFPIIM